MRKQDSGASAGKTDDAGNEVVDQVVARVLAAMQEQSNGQSEAGGQARQKMDDVTEQARQKAGGVVETVQQQAASRLDKQKEHAVEELTRVAGTVRQMGEQLKQPEHGAVVQYTAQYGDMAADHLQNLSSYLGTHDVKQLVREVESFARREPLLFTGGAFLLGLIGARFLKSKPVSEETPSASPHYASPREASAPLALPMPQISLADESSSADYASLADDATDDATDDEALIAGDDSITADDAVEVAASPS